MCGFSCRNHGLTAAATQVSVETPVAKVRWNDVTPAKETVDKLEWNDVTPAKAGVQCKLKVKRAGVPELDPGFAGMTYD